MKSYNKTGVKTKENRDLIKKYKKRLEKFVSVDPQTGVYNFRYFEHHFTKIFEEAKKKSWPLSLVIIDIDYFKSVNDAYGYTMGNSVLHQLATLLKTETRTDDLVCRYGGEEFAIVMPKTNIWRACNIAKNIVNKVSEEKFGDKKTNIKLTVSVGICSYPNEKFNTYKQFISRVEGVLSLSKEQGGNIVTCSRKESDKEEMDETPGISLQNKINDKIGFKNKKVLMEFVHALANTVKVKDRYTQKHSEAMSKLAVEIANRLGMSNSEIETLRLGAILHDLGKIGINESILLKPGKLTKEEYEIVKQHPQIGAEIIRTVHALKDAIPLILYHHERYDGSGYLKGLKGDEIPLGARIIGLADTYQALRSDRPYRKALPKETALKIIEEEAGKQFDPKIVEVFLSIVKKLDL